MMIKKPSGCLGCPFYSHGDYFTPDVVADNSEVLFIAQNPGPDEEKGLRLVKRHWHSSNQYMDEKEQVTPQPLIGATGQMFDRQFLPLSGMKRSDVSLANAIRCRPGQSLGLKADELPTITTTMKLESSKADIVKALKHCRDTYLKIPQSVRLIVTMGRYAMFSLTGIQSEEVEYGKKKGVMQSWRGYGVGVNSFDTFKTVDTASYDDFTSDKRIFFTMHLAALFKGMNKIFHHATQQDFNKIKTILQHKWPSPLPEWNTSVPTVWPKYSVFDTEYIPDTNELIRWSLCDTNNHLYCIESDNTSHSGIPIQPGSTVVMQNALADIGYLRQLTDIHAINIEDMMLAHSVLHTGEPHNLNYIASMYGAFNRYKHLNIEGVTVLDDREMINNQLYSALDAYEPMHMWRNYFIPAFKQDQQSWRVYKQFRLPLIPIIDRAQQTGVKVNTIRLGEVQKILMERLQEMQETAREITGNDKFNLGGRKAMMEEIYG